MPDDGMALFHSPQPVLHVCREGCLEGSWQPLRQIAVHTAEGRVG